jgi:hypothetical protein
MAATGAKKVGLSKFLIVCRQCDKHIHHWHETAFWGVEEDSELRNRLSQHTWSLENHRHMSWVACQEESITVWDDAEEPNEYTYDDPRDVDTRGTQPRTVVKAEKQDSPTPNRASGSAGAADDGPSQTQRWMHTVMQRLQNIEGTVQRIEEMMRAETVPVVPDNRGVYATRSRSRRRRR